MRVPSRACACFLKDGGFTPSFDAAQPIQTPGDPTCQEKLEELLRCHGRIVVKPAVGANSKGVLLVSKSAETLRIRGEAELTASSDSREHLINANENAERSALDAVADHSVGSHHCSEDERSRVPLHVCVGSPIKTWRSAGSITPRCIRILVQPNTRPWPCLYTLPQSSLA